MVLWYSNYWEGRQCLVFLYVVDGLELSASSDYNGMLIYFQGWQAQWWLSSSSMDWTGWKFKMYSVYHMLWQSRALEVSHFGCKSANFDDTIFGCLTWVVRLCWLDLLLFLFMESYLIIVEVFYECVLEVTKLFFALMDIWRWFLFLFQFNSYENDRPIYFSLFNRLWCSGVFFIIVSLALSAVNLTAP